MIEKECKICGNKFYVKIHRMDTAKFCSRKCMGINNHGKNNPHWKEKIKKHCMQCNKVINVLPCLKNRKNFCSKECQYSYYSMYNHPNWQGGSLEIESMRKTYKFVKWMNKIHSINNYICLICGKYGNNIHHVYPIRSFPEMTYDEDNVVILCSTCHNKYEGTEYIGLFDIIRSYNDTN